MRRFFMAIANPALSASFLPVVAAFRILAASDLSLSSDRI
jgi:hypothetical protein